MTFHVYVEGEWSSAHRIERRARKVAKALSLAHGPVTVVSGDTLAQIVFVDGEEQPIGPLMRCSLLPVPNK